MHPLAANFESFMEKFRRKPETSSIKEKEDTMRGFLTQDPFDTVSVGSAYRNEATSTVSIAFDSVQASEV